MKTISEMIQSNPNLPWISEDAKNYNLKINNDEKNFQKIPILMQKKTILYDIVGYLLNLVQKNSLTLSYINIKTKEDAFYFFLTLVAKNSIIKTDISGFPKNMLMIENFFLKLEDLLIYKFDFFQLQTIIQTSRYNKQKKDEKIKKKFGSILKIFDNIPYTENTKLNYFDYLSILSIEQRINKIEYFNEKNNENYSIKKYENSNLKYSLQEIEEYDKIINYFKQLED
jgi:hypothetical protein